MVDRASRELGPTLAEWPELGEIAVRLLEVPTDDLRVLGKTIAGCALEPIGEARVQIRSGLLRERIVGGIADQEMAELECLRVHEVGSTGRTSSLRTSSWSRDAMPPDSAVGASSSRAPT